ncbi:hypothetical protein HK097_010646, partial [Rhizophlyctis rosea]
MDTQTTLTLGGASALYHLAYVLGIHHDTLRKALFYRKGRSGERAWEVLSPADAVARLDAFGIGLWSMALAVVGACVSDSLKKLPHTREPVEKKIRFYCVSGSEIPIQDGMKDSMVALKQNAIVEALLASLYGETSLVKVRARRVGAVHMVSATEKFVDMTYWFTDPLQGRYEGILPMLDDVTHYPNTTDEEFLQKVMECYEDVVQDMDGKTLLRVKHRSGTVVYNPQ